MKEEKEEQVECQHGIKYWNTKDNVQRIRKADKKKDQIRRLMQKTKRKLEEGQRRGNKHWTQRGLHGRKGQKEEVKSTKKSRKEM